MNKLTAQAKLIRIKIEEDASGLFFATSPDLRGLLVAKLTVPELENDLARAISELYAVTGEEVLVSQVDGANWPRSWVAFPATIAREHLKEPT